MFSSVRGVTGRPVGPRRGEFPAAAKRPQQTQVWSQTVTQSPAFLRCGLKSPQALGFAINYEMFGQTFSTGFILSIFNIKPTTKCWVSIQGMAFKLIHSLAASTTDSNPLAERSSCRLQFQTNFVEPLGFFFFPPNTFPSYYMTIH